MKFPIENGTRKPLTIFVELETLEKVIPSGGKAVVTLPDNPTSFLEVRDGLVVVWNNGPGEATIETWTIAKVAGLETPFTDGELRSGLATAQSAVRTTTNGGLRLPPSHFELRRTGRLNSPYGPDEIERLQNSGSKKEATRGGPTLWSEPSGGVPQPSC